VSFIEREFMEVGLCGGEVVFLGDSITAGGAWHEWFPDVPVVNRGIDGDTSLDRLHLNEVGYRAWTTVLQPLVRSA
jgi:hypothetical protein